MERTAAQMATVLRELYDENFGGDEYEPFRLGWGDLRQLSGVAKVTDGFITAINCELAGSDHALVPFSDFLMVTSEADCRQRRKLPGRVLENYLPEQAVEEECDEDGDNEEEEIDDL